MQETIAHIPALHFHHRLLETRSARPRPSTWLVLALAMVIAAGLLPMQVQATVVDLGKDGDIEVPIGQDLEIIWPHGPKESEITVSLISSTNITIATRTVAVGTTSWTEPILLWPVTGVWGCDDPDLTNESPFRFQTFEDAMVSLLPWTFYLLVEGSETSLLVRFVEPTEAIYYFSDDKACPRALFARSEARYLSGWIPEPGFLPQELTFFLQREECDRVSDSLLETRSEPQVIELGPWVRAFTEPIGTGCQLGGGAFVGLLHAAGGADCMALEDEPCGLLSCDSTPEQEIYAYAIDPSYMQRPAPGLFPTPSPVRCGWIPGLLEVEPGWAYFSGKSQGHTSSDWDDGRCDSCG